MQSLGAWKSATVLTDHISLEVGFSKQAMLAQCLTVDYGGGEEKFIHLKKNSPWFIAAVGGPNCKRSSLPAVRVIDALQSKLFGAGNKQVVDDADRGGGEHSEKEEAYDPDPMDLLGADLGCPELETPKKCKHPGLKRKMDSNLFKSTNLVRAIDMPKRPTCAGRDCAEMQTVHMHVKPKSTALWIRLDSIDWLVSYAADEHYYQGVTRSDPLAAVAAKDYELDFDYNDKTWGCKINVGIDTGVSLTLDATRLTKEMYEKAASSDPPSFPLFYCMATAAMKRKACCEYLTLWALAAVQGSRQDFEDEVLNHHAGDPSDEVSSHAGQVVVTAREVEEPKASSSQESPSKKPKLGEHCDTAVAASQAASAASVDA